MADIVEFNAPNPNELNPKEAKIVAETIYAVYAIVSCLSGSESNQVQNAELARDVLGSLVSIYKNEFDPEVVIALGLKLFKPLTVTNDRYLHMYNHFVELQKQFKAKLN